jgi:hypothetical protein
MKTTRPLASLSLDLDNQWSYMKTHGDPEWKSFPSYLDIVIPRVLDFLRGRNQKITFFVVGQDAALDKNAEALSQLSAAGHEIGNHSFNHEPWLHLYSEGQIETELMQAEEHIERVTGQRPIGFRGPGFSLSKATLEVLHRRGYLYDATTLPTFLGPLARAYYLMTAKLSDEERRRRKALFGAFGDGFRPLKPYLWKAEPRGLIEIPVTTMPGLRVPFHVSYLLYLYCFSPRLALMYFKLAIALCVQTQTHVSLLLHPLDFLGGAEVPELSFFPGMSLSGERKIDFVGRVIDYLDARFNIVTLGQYARQCQSDPTLRVVQPEFSQCEQLFAQPTT